MPIAGKWLTVACVGHLSLVLLSLTGLYCWSVAVGVILWIANAVVVLGWSVRGRRKRGKKEKYTCSSFLLDYMSYLLYAFQTKDWMNCPSYDLDQHQ